MSEFEERRRTLARRQVGHAIAEHLDCGVGDLAEVTGGCPDQIAEALADALELGEMKRAIAERESAREEEPGRCCNQVCREWVSHEGEDIGLDGAVTFTGRQSFCRQGAAFAVGCLFRMRASPPNHLDGVTCQPLPEWSEAVNLLRQNGLLEPDDFGRWNGTDFSFKVRRLWWALVGLLVETGRIDRCWIEDAEIDDTGEQARRAKALLFPADCEPGGSC